MSVHVVVFIMMISVAGAGNHNYILGINDIYLSIAAITKVISVVFKI